MCNGSAESIENFDDTGILLHRNNSKLILFVDPDKEGLGVVMEDTSTGWPVSVEIACIQESVSLFEKEVVFNKLFLISFAHGFERVESSLKISFESGSSFSDESHNFESLFFGDTWAKWEISQVSSNSDSCRLDHLSIFLGEFGVLDTVRSHVRDVLGIWSVLMIVLNNLIKKFVEGSVGIVRSCIESNTGVLVGNTREDAGLESNACSARLVFILFPNFFGHAF